MKNKLIELLINDRLDSADLRVFIRLVLIHGHRGYNEMSITEIQNEFEEVFGEDKLKELLGAKDG